MPMDIEKRENESALAYHKRLIYGKLVDKTLSDLDYTELAERLYGKEYASDVARRMMYGSRKTLELLDEESIHTIPANEMLDEIESKKVELQKERQKFFDQRREFSKLVAKDGRADYMMESLARYAEMLSESIGRVYDEDLPCYEISDNEAVLVLSDWHFGMTASNIFNKYDVDICKSRVKEVIDRAIEKIAVNHCRRVHVVGLGDFIHGDCHVSARVASSELA